MRTIAKAATRERFSISGMGRNRVSITSKVEATESGRCAEKRTVSRLSVLFYASQDAEA